jgi:hypothetical protein
MKERFSVSSGLTVRERLHQVESCCHEKVAHIEAVGAGLDTDQEVIVIFGQSVQRGNEIGQSLLVVTDRECPAIGIIGQIPDTDVMTGLPHIHPYVISSQIKPSF